MKSAAAIFIALLLGALAHLHAAETPSTHKATFADVPYGSHARQKLDFYQAKSDKPTPVVFFIHGGGWLNGDKGAFNNEKPYLKAGISVVSINYRLIPDADAEKLVPPVQGPLQDAARALQFVRSKASEWNIDKERIGATGSSAGSCSALWLAFHPDMAEAKSADPVARESTRLGCVAVVRAQTSLDPKQMRAWISNCNYGAHAFGFKGDGRPDSAFAEFLAKRESVLPWIAEYSPYALLTADDPPVYLLYNTPPAMGRAQESTAHSANFGVGLQQQCRKLGVPCELVYPAAPEVKHAEVAAYLIERLKAEK